MDFLNNLNPNATAGAIASGEWQGIGGRLEVNSMRPHSGLHANALLRRHEWEAIDRTVVDVARTELNVVQDIINAGLTRELGGLGSTVAVWEQLKDMNSAEVYMDAPTRIDEDRVGFTPVYTPVPIIGKPFRVSARQLEASRRMGEGLDMTQTTVATRKVRDRLENMTMNGEAGIAVNYEGSNRSIYGLTTQPSRLTDTAGNYGGGDFGTEGNGYSTINGQIGALKAAGFMGPYGCYVGRTQHTQLGKRHTDGSGKSELMTIRENLTDLLYIKPSDVLADGSVVVFQMTRDVVEFAIAQDFTTVQWSSFGGMVDHFLVMTAMVPLVKDTEAGACGISHAIAA